MRTSDKEWEHTRRQRLLRIKRQACAVMKICLAYFISVFSFERCKQYERFGAEFLCISERVENSKINLFNVYTCNMSYPSFQFLSNGKHLMENFCNRAKKTIGSWVCSDGQLPACQTLQPGLVRRCDLVWRWGAKSTIFGESWIIISNDSVFSITFGFYLANFGRCGSWSLERCSVIATVKIQAVGHKILLKRQFNVAAWMTTSLFDTANPTYFFGNAA